MVNSVDGFLNSILHQAEFASIWFGFSSLIMAFITVYHFWPKARIFMINPSGRDCAGWLSLGIFVGFVCSALDSAYWQLAWMSAYMDWAVRVQLFKYGVIANIPFRNIALIFGAYCHYRAILIVLPDRNAAEAGYVTIFSLIAGLLLALIPLLIK